MEDFRRNCGLMLSQYYWILGKIKIKAGTKPRMILCAWSGGCESVHFFVCVEVLRPIQPNGVMSSAVSLPNHTFTGHAKSSKRLTSIVHILSPETDNCPSLISGRERMTLENIS